VALWAVLTVTAPDVAPVADPALVVVVVAPLEPQAVEITSSAANEPPASHRDRRDEPIRDSRTFELYVVATVDGIGRTSFRLCCQYYDR
jgi:hypothetical protein